MNLKKLALGMMIVGALTSGSAIASNFSRIHPEVKLEQKIEQQLDKRDYVKYKNNAEIIEYDKNHTNVQYYSHVDGKVIDDVLHQDEMIYDGIKLTYHWDAVQYSLDRIYQKDFRDRLQWRYDNFTKQTITAIELIRQYDPGLYQDLKKFVKEIKFDRKGTCAGPGPDGKIHIGLGESFDILDLYIGRIAHELMHIKQLQRPCEERKTYYEMEEEAHIKQLETQKLMQKNGCKQITDYEIGRSEDELKDKEWISTYHIIWGKEKGDELLNSKPPCR